MGMMLETTDEGLMRSFAHLRAPDKDPSRRLDTLMAAKRVRRRLPLIEKRVTIELAGTKKRLAAHA
jgi:hypothetical protein